MRILPVMISSTTATDRDALLPWPVVPFPQIPFFGVSPVLAVDHPTVAFVPLIADKVLLLPAPDPGRALRVCTYMCVCVHVYVLC